jgi:glycine betaine/proline transport system substrate-binding protein
LKRAGLLAGTAAAALVLAACADAENGEPSGGDGVLAGASITIAAFNGWEEGIAATYLWKIAFEEQGAEVEIQFADVQPVYDGVATGEWDIGFDAWLPATHEPYWETYGDQLEDLGAWFTEAPLTIAVNEDAPIQSLTELADNFDAFDNRIVGIDPGAGLTRITKESVIPTYGLPEGSLVESSTAAMITELRGAVTRGEHIVVTLWQPHWAYDAFPIRNLEDPENALGDPEEIHSFARPGFSAEYPEIAEWVGNWTFSAEDLHSLENVIFNEIEADSPEQYEAAVRQWLEDNPAVLTQMTGM